MKGKARIPNLTHQQILDALEYNPATGIFKWKISPAKNVKAGTVAGGKSYSGGYRYIRVHGYEITEARLAWFYMTGEWPDRRIRTKNGDTTDCRFENLVQSEGAGSGYDLSSREGRIEYQRAYRKATPHREKERSLKADFGISLDAYNQMLLSQNGLCDICKQPETHKRNGRVKSLAVDHHHGTGKIRALLCADCNTGIGKLKDSPEILEAAAAYIRKHATEI
jgi:hypothetical protein